jgi:ATP-dependent RNA helicase RhlE
MSFENLNLIEPIRKALQTEGYTKPTPIQAQAIPIILQGKDLLGCAQTGTGKTAAFAIPTLQLLHNRQLAEQERGQRRIKALVLTPTRELAIQIGASFAAYGAHTQLKHTVIFGGVSQKAQTDALQRGVDILVATPGRLLDLISQRLINLQHISLFVLDEADRMLDMGFIHDVKKVLALLPAKKQSLFFSATMPPAIVSLAGSILHNPTKVEVTPVSSTADTIRQAVYMVDRENKNDLLIHILENKEIETVLVFTRTKHGADKVARLLTKNGIKAEAIHGNKSQNARQRALENFKNKEIRVLVATDIAARGIDVDELAYVINFEIPNIPETYVHRIGRTGRAGASGVAYSFCDVEEKEFLRDIYRLIGKSVPEVKDHPYPMTGIIPVAKETAGKSGQPFQRKEHSRPFNSANRQSGNQRSGNRSFAKKRSY